MVSPVPCNAGVFPGGKRNQSILTGVFGGGECLKCTFNETLTSRQNEKRMRCQCDFIVMIDVKEKHCFPCAVPRALYSARRNRVSDMQLAQGNLGNTDLPPLIRGLQNPEAYPHSVQQFSLHETHLSWVILTGTFAYKIKKPVNLQFADFSTLERRRHFCDEELRLNRRYSEDLYLEVAPITGTPEHPHVCQDGEVIEFALRMRQFREDHQLNNLVTAGKLTRELVRELAQVIYHSHCNAALAPESSSWGTPENLWAAVAENFRTFEQLTAFHNRQNDLTSLKHWSSETFEQIENTLISRRRAGHVRECHGDLHLGNIVLWNGKVTPFDCIEFNPDFRWIDTLNEIAFVVMDLDSFLQTHLSMVFLNESLEQSGDYAGLAVLPFYSAYRALIRAKVNLIRIQQSEMCKKQQEALHSAVDHYVDLAIRYTRRQALSLTITHGLSGSGKTTGTQKLVETQGAIRLRSDVERKRKFGPGSSAIEMYSAAATAWTYDHLAELARIIIDAGFPVVIDATFLRRADRKRFRQLAQELRVPFQIAHFEAAVPELKKRILQRSASRQDASDATIDVLEKQLTMQEPLTDDELRFCIA